MILNLKAVLLRDLVLELLNSLIEKLDDLPRVHAHHVIVVAEVGELEHRCSPFEYMALNEIGLLELGQNSIDGSESNITP